MLNDFLSSHTSAQHVVSIHVEPEVVYLVEEKDSFILNFDFLLKGLSEKNLVIKFIKVAVYDKEDKLITFRHLNHNGIGNPSIHTLGKYDLEGKEELDVFNPFFRFSKDVSISYLRYMFTFADKETGEEFYYGNVLVKPVRYEQRVHLSLPLKGTIVILDGNDFYSHHRRVSISILKKFTRGIFKSNFNRFGLDFSILGIDGNLREMSEDEKDKNYDFHITDVKKFYTHETPVYAPADGEIVEIVDNLEDLYENSFDIDVALAENRIKDLAGNYIVIKHNESEFSHLFHLLKGSCKVKPGDFVKRGEDIAQVGFSGASTVYSHLHYQLLDGSDILKSKELPIKFSNVLLYQGSEKRSYDEIVLNTGDMFQTNV